MIRARYPLIRARMWYLPGKYNLQRLLSGICFARWRHVVRKSNIFRDSPPICQFFEDSTLFYHSPRPFLVVQLRAASSTDIVQVFVALDRSSLYGFSWRYCCASRAITPSPSRSTAGWSATSTPWGRAQSSSLAPSLLPWLASVIRPGSLIGISIAAAPSNWSYTPIICSWCPSHGVLCCMTSKEWREPTGTKSGY
jgi:hypothetical protein